MVASKGHLQIVKLMEVLMREFAGKIIIKKLIRMFIFNNLSASLSHARMIYLAPLLLASTTVWAEFDFNTGVDSSTGFVNVYYQDPGTFSSTMYNYQVANSNYLLNSNNSFSESVTQAPQPAPGGLKKTKVPNAGKRASKATINRMASALPAGVQAQAKQVYNELYVKYLELEKFEGLPKFDVAGAVAAFIAGNYIAYSGNDVADADFVALANQVRGTLRTNRAFLKLKPNKKRMLYEQLAIQGMFMAVVKIAIIQQPTNDDLSLRVQEAARQYLEGLFNVSADRIVIDSSGVSIAE